MYLIKSAVPTMNLPITRNMVVISQDVACEVVLMEEPCVSSCLVSYSQVHVSSPYIKNLDKWRKHGANATTDNSSVAANTDIVFLAVKPHMLPEVIDSLQKSANCQKIKNKLFVSILAGFTLDKLESLLVQFLDSRVIRVMPNTPMMVGEGCTVYCPGKNVTDEDISIVERILSVSGICEMVPESMFNAITALSGSGPSFVYLAIEALSDGAVKMGLHREMATKFAIQTVLGAAKMALQTGKHTGILKDEVCSAGGTTIAGIHALEKAGFRKYLCRKSKVVRNMYSKKMIIYFI